MYARGCASDNNHFFTSNKGNKEDENIMMILFGLA
ncbi:unnamed protein product [Rhodiola kirilowii]